MILYKFKPTMKIGQIVFNNVQLSFKVFYNNMWKKLFNHLAIQHLLHGFALTPTQIFNASTKVHYFIPVIWHGFSVIFVPWTIRTEEFGRIAGTNSKLLFKKSIVCAGHFLIISSLSKNSMFDESFNFVTYWMELLPVYLMPEQFE